MPEFISYKLNGFQAFLLVDKEEAVSWAYLNLDSYVLQDAETIESRRKEGLFSTLCKNILAWINTHDFGSECVRLLSTDEALSIYKKVGFELVSSLSEEMYSGGGRHEMIYKKQVQEK
jgi:hypothetical protein